MVNPKLPSPLTKVTRKCLSLVVLVSSEVTSPSNDVVIVDEMNGYYDVKIKEGNLKLLKEKYPEERRLSIYRGDIYDDDYMLQVSELERPDLSHGRQGRSEAKHCRPVPIHSLQHQGNDSSYGAFAQVWS